MSAPVTPVELSGFTFERTLGAGGFADVHLYTQHMPRRAVAVKVLRHVVDEPESRRNFESEANAMAALSSHPSIVTIYHAAISDDGLPYLVMEYCSRPTLDQRYRTRPLSVPEMLQTLIRLSGAVETAHRSGILHRDIKPANVLTTDYGWPALTDFGIASMAGESIGAEDALSLSWAPPEAISARSYDARSDVYALAATAYTILAGRAPFDDGIAVDTSTLAARILTVPPRRIPRDDVPDGLQRLLAIALSKNPADRPQTAVEFARGLQVVEQEMHLPVTHLDVPADIIAGHTTREDGESTRMTGGSGSTEPQPGFDEPIDDHTALSEHDLFDHTVLSNRVVGNPVSEVEDHTVLSNRVIEVEDQTVLSNRVIEVEDHTVLSNRVVQPEDKTALSSRGEQPDDHTVLSARGSEVDDSTVLSDRAAELDDSTALASRAPAVNHTAIVIPEAVDHTVVVHRPAAFVPPPVEPTSRSTRVPAVPKNFISAGPVTSQRTAYTPNEQPLSDRIYRARAEPLQAPITRTTPAPPPAPRHDAPPRPRRRPWIPVLIIVSILTAAGAIAGIVALLGLG